MEITLGAEVALSLHLPNATNYADLEAVLVDAGFTDYTIMRSVNVDGSGDAQLYVRGGYDSSGQPILMPAGDTVTKLAEAINTLEDNEAEPETPA